MRGIRARILPGVSLGVGEYGPATALYDENGKRLRLALKPMPLQVPLNVFPGDENLACHSHAAQLACAPQVADGLLAVTRAQQAVMELLPALDMAKVDPESAKANLSTAVEGAARLSTTDICVAKGYLVRDCTLKAFSLEYSGPNDGSQSELSAPMLCAEEGEGGVPMRPVCCEAGLP